MTIPLFFQRAHSAGFFLPNFANEKKYFENTNCLILDGKKVADEIVNQCKKKITHSTSLDENKKPNLAVILVGNNQASQIYVKNKIKVFEAANFYSKIITMTNEEATYENIVHCIHDLNQNSDIDGILIQLPLPKHLDSHKILKEIHVQKDVDGFSAQNIGLLALNDSTATLACTPFGIMILLYAYGINPEGKHCVIVGRSSIVGKPIGLLLLNANATVTFVHSYTDNLGSYTREADILIVAAGKKHIINENDIQNGAIVIDIGIHKNNDCTLSGDVHPNVQKKAKALTPVPGGVGPMTIVSLLLNTALCATQI